MFTVSTVSLLCLLLLVNVPVSAGQVSTSAAGTSAAHERPSWGALDATGSGVVVHRSDVAEISLGAYAVVRYINQLPADQQFTDHLGNIHDIDTRNDIQFHRVMIHFRGCCCRRKRATRSRYGQ